MQIGQLYERSKNLKIGLNTDANGIDFININIIIIIDKK